MPDTIPDSIRRILRRLEKTLRICVGLDGAVSVLFAVICFLVFDFLLDRFFEFPLIIRTILLPVFLGTGLYLIVKQVFSRCFAGFQSDQLAAVFEKYVPELNESLFTVISPNRNESIHPELLRQTLTEAADALHGIRIRNFLRTGRLAIRLSGVLVCTGLLSVFCFWNSELTGLWFSRNVLLSPKEYPRRSQLFAEGFNEGRIRIARGDSFTLTILANTQKPLVPDTIRIRIGMPETGYRKLLIDQFHTENRNGIRYRVFSLNLPEMLETVTLQISGADTVLNDYCIEVLAPPMLADLTFRQTFPDYMPRQERTAVFTGRTMIPEGTAITLFATSTKPLQKAVAMVNGTETVLDPQNIKLSLPEVRDETVAVFHLTDTDSLTNRRPIRAEFGMIKDRPPEITARLEGIGSAVTPDAELPVAGEITDDYGLVNVMYRYNTELVNVENNSPRQPVIGTVPITELAPGQTTFRLSAPFNVAPLAVLPGDKLTLFVEANDAFNLDSSKGQTGIGQRFQLDIVTPEHLKTLLETREIAFRQRFEVVLGEVERTKNILNEYSLEPMPEQLQNAGALTLEEREDESPAERELRQRELDSEKQKLRDTILNEQAELGMYHISRMLRDTQKESYDLIGIAESFRAMRLEMINNRIYTESERRRIDQEILIPMQELTNSDFLETDRLLNVLHQRLVGRTEPNRPSALSDRQNVLDQFDRTVLKMQMIRDRMASMESFNEAVELLRTIIERQQQLRHETNEEKNRRLRDLLE